MGHLILLHPSRGSSVNATPHLSIDDAASYIDGTLTDESRVHVERHLAECDTCREEVAASARLIATLPAQAGRRLPWRLVFPLAAGILVAVMLARPTRRTDVAPAQERGAPSDASQIVLVAPVPDATVVAGSPRFVWHPIASSIGYRVVIKDASGAPVWSGDATDTFAPLPDQLLPNDADTYFNWGVYQNPGAVERLPTLCTKYKGTHLVDGAGHWVQQEQPAEVAKLVIDFIRSNV